MEEALHIISEHLCFAEGHPEVVEQAARSASITKHAALAFMIMEELFERVDSLNSGA
jgi:hypothetical protein